MKLPAVACRVVLILGCFVFALGFVAIASQFPALIMVAAVAAVWARLRWKGSGYAYGTARVASVADLARGGLLAKDGLILGRVGYTRRPSGGQAVRALLSSRLASDVACRVFLAAFPFLGSRQANEFVRINKFVHLMTVAPAGKGKSVSVLIPNLMSYRGSVVANDPKGELYKLTSCIRRSKLGQPVYRLDPLEVCGQGSDSLNPLDFIDDKAPDFLDQCRDVANQLVLRQGTEHEPFWDDACELVLTAMIAFVCACEPNPMERHLGTVRKLVAARQRFVAAVLAMQQVQTHGGLIAQLGHLLTWFIESGDDKGDCVMTREGSSVLSTLHRHTAWMDSPVVAASLMRTSFDLRLLRSDRPATLHFILPEDKLIVLQGLTRLWVGTVLRACTRAGADERNPVLFLLDEAGHIGKIRALEDATTLLRGKGIRLWFFFQSLNQMQVCYGEKASVIQDNIDTQQYFGINSLETAKAVSERIGDFTFLAESLNDTRGRSWPDGPSPHGPTPGTVSTSRAINSNEIARRLLKPEEILTLPEDLGLVFHRNLPVITTKLVKSYRDPEFARELQGGAAALPTAPVSAKSGLGLGQIVASACLSALMLAGLFMLIVGVMNYLDEQARSSQPPFIAPLTSPPPPAGPAGVRPLPSDTGLYGREADSPFGRSMGMPPGPYPASRAVPSRPRGRSRTLPGGRLIRVP
jgi:type IV secretion system protein VirD4